MKIKAINCYFILSALILLFVTGCNYASNEPSKPPVFIDESILNTKAGVRPKNVIGTEALPEFLSEITDHIYVHESGAGEEIFLTSLLKEDNTYTCNWYTGTTGKWIPVTEDKHEDNLKITIAKDTTYFILELVSPDGKSKAYSNVCTVICGSDKTEKVGMILYRKNQDFLLKSDYSSEYGTPIGIVCEVKDDGTPKNVVTINKNLQKYSWCSSDAEGFNKKIQTSTKDGKDNWNIIKADVSDFEFPGKYPVFEDAIKLTDGGKTWFVPARDELIAIKMNRNAINEAMAKLPSEYRIIGFLDSGYYISSSQSGKYDNKIWIVSFGKSEVVQETKSTISCYNIFVAAY